MSAGLGIATPTGRAPTFSKVVTDACDLISEAPAGAVHRSVLSGVFRVVRATDDAAELADAIGQLRGVAAGRGATCEDFDAVRASAIEIASRGRRRA
jgi:hypothetical protein